MQPAAKPRARGNKEVKVSTNMKEGTANKGWGRAVARAHQAAFLAGTPLDTSTVATANPSGMLCRPMARVTSMPCVQIKAFTFQFMHVARQETQTQCLIQLV